jgi:hypothetical protein
VVKLTPPGSECSIIIGTEITSAAPGSVEALQLTVFDIEPARAGLVGRGVAVREVFQDVGGVFHHAGTEGRVPGPDPQRADYGSLPRSAIRTATVGCSKRSRRALPDVDRTRTTDEEDESWT